MTNLPHTIQKGAYMVFHLLKRIPSDIINYQNVTILVKDNWDDWFTYETQSFMYYVDSNGSLHEIGTVKIGQKNMKKGQRSVQIPDIFNSLPADCFSLGQSDFYYENINHLGDVLREEILSGLHDLAYYPELYNEVRNLEVTRISLMRDVSHFTVTRQYRRIAKGNARLTEYEIKYTYPMIDDENQEPVELTFNVIPESNPPTNIHVVIGRNNVGKTYLIKNILSSIYSIDDGIDHGVLRATNDITGRLVKSTTQAFANVLCVSFSPFDDYSGIVLRLMKKKAMPFTYIGINQGVASRWDYANNETLSNRAQVMSLSEVLREDFGNALEDCLRTKRKFQMLDMALPILEADPIFANSELKALINSSRFYRDKTSYKNDAQRIFQRLSSGHQVIMLTLVQLIAHLTERTFVILDEPENHLHPPLLAAFVRALSELLINYNGVALIATHSPVILQEVPRSCVWRLNRNGSEVNVSRLEIESFGATIGELTREVFGLEVRQSGFHKMLAEEVDKGLSYAEIINVFNGELGDEALALLQTLILLRDTDGK